MNPERTDLSPCPFCGVPGHLTNVYSREWEAACNNDKCPIMPRTRWGHKGVVLEQWEKRVAPATHKKKAWGEREALVNIAKKKKRA